MTGDADAIVRVHTTDNKDLERLIMELQRDGSVVRTRSQVVLSHLVTPRGLTGRGAPRPCCGIAARGALPRVAAGAWRRMRKRVRVAGAVAADAHGGTALAADARARGERANGGR